MEYEIKQITLGTGMFPLLLIYFMHMKRTGRNKSDCALTEIYGILLTKGLN